MPRNRKEESQQAGRQHLVLAEPWRTRPLHPSLSTSLLSQMMISPSVGCQERGRDWETGGDAKAERQGVGSLSLSLSLSLGKHEHAFIRAMREMTFLARFSLPQQPDRILQYVYLHSLYPASFFTSALPSSTTLHGNRLKVHLLL